jgi:hypothetical protein
MRRLVVNILALALVLTGANIGLGQSQPGRPPGAPPGGAPGGRPGAPPGAPPGGARLPAEDKTQPSKSKLEEMLAEALKNNPDIRVAAAKVAKADAELNRTRLQVTQKVVALYYAIDTQKKTIALQEEKSGVLEAQFRSGKLPSEPVINARQELALAKAKLAELEAQLPALIGKAAQTTERDALGRPTRMAFSPDGNRLVAEWDLVPHKAAGPMADKIRKALETPITVNYKDMNLSDILKDLEKKAPGLSIRDFPRPNDIKLTLHFKEALPVSAIMQALADDSHMSFVVREYGILVTLQGGEPPGAMTVQEFMRQKPADAPHGDVRGVIKQVDPSGLVTISIGSDAGLSKGHTLDVYRLGERPSESKYLGSIRILEVKEKEAVAQPLGRMLNSPQVGDKITKRIFGDSPPWEREK